MRTTEACPDPPKADEGERVGTDEVEGVPLISFDKPFAEFILRDEGLKGFGSG